MEHDTELDVMRDALAAMKKLDDKDAQARVLAWVQGRLGIAAPTKGNETKDQNQSETVNEDQPFATFADLYSAASPTTNGDKVAVGAYWLQVVQGQEQFAALSVSKELLHVGEIISNVTEAFSSLKARKPALALQVKKSGKSRQARKLYKLTQPGVDHVRAMLKQREG